MTVLYDTYTTSTRHKYNFFSLPARYGTARFGKNLTCEHCQNRAEPARLEQPTRHGSIVVDGDMIAIEHAQELVLKWRGGTTATEGCKRNQLVYNKIGNEAILGELYGHICHNIICVYTRKIMCSPS